MENEKFKIDFSNGIVKQCYKNKNGKKTFLIWKLFLDQKGAKIITKNGVIYMTPENSEVL